MDLTRVMAVLGNLVLERVTDGRFLRHAQPPPWCATLGLRALTGDAPFLVAEAFPFLEIFLPEAERIWRSELPAATSEFWTEYGAGREEVHLQASALRVDSRNLLVVMRNEQLFAQQELVLQRARELRMAHTELTREIELKDILVHSIVHDLASPLHGILGALSLLSELPLDEEAASLSELALQAAKREQSLVADILDVFSAEHGGPMNPPAPSAAPDLALAIEEVVSQTQPAARVKRMQIHAEVPPGPLRVVAEETRLLRVLANLVQNALAHSPSGGRVVVSTEQEEHTIRVNVDDEGPGVVAEVLPHLFELFAGRKRSVKGTGLGLYFCRITVESWGGGIGYERRLEGGSRFWIRLSDPLRPKPRA